jgi:hypothetical protein
VSLISRVAVEAELSFGLLAEVPLVDGPEVGPWIAVRSAVGQVRPPLALLIEFMRANYGPQT